MTEHGEFDAGVAAIVNLLNIEKNDPGILETARRTGSQVATVYDMCQKYFV